MTFEMKLLLFVDAYGNMQDLWMTTPQFSISREKHKYIYWIHESNNFVCGNVQASYPYYIVVQVERVLLHVGAAESSYHRWIGQSSNSLKAGIASHSSI
jgi:hypothetical protein